MVCGVYTCGVVVLFPISFCFFVGMNRSKTFGLVLELAHMMWRKFLTGRYKIGCWQVEAGKLGRDLNWDISSRWCKSSFGRSLWTTKPGGRVHAQI